ncbi:hypothetical protein ACFZCT_32500 [Streptomyces qaidamensis]|uniref:hypothetical protein n=1 Tax=Streptomyces qaidamensis TaxID=1783515 RepID=UPI0036EBAF16
MQPCSTGAWRPWGCPAATGAVFLAGPTFTLLPDDAPALAALRGIRAHLAEGGTALVPLFTPAPTPAEQIGRVRTAAAPDGAELRVSVVAEQRDETARTQTTLLRYEPHHGTDSTVEERRWTMHWYPRDHFEKLAATAGLAVTAVTDADGEPAGADDTGVLHFRLQIS